MDTKDNLGISEPTDKRRRYSRAEADQLVADWKASGLSGPAFAETQGVTSKTLYRWHHRLRQDRPTLSRVVMDNSASGNEDSAETFAIIAPSGLRVELPMSCSDALLQRVCRVLAC